MSDTVLLPDSVIEAVRDDLWEGLNRPLPEVSPKYFYDQRGSELFEQITELDEYYPTRTERRLLERWAPSLIDQLKPRALMELGAGSAQKTRILLDAMADQLPGGRFVPLDVSGAFLEQTALELRQEYPGLEILPEVADFTAHFQLANPLLRPALIALIGGTIGNFEPDQAVSLLRRTRALMQPGDSFLLGVDLRPGPGKSVEELEAAYDDQEGVTAEFNLNILNVLNDQAGTNFPLDGFRHHAFYDPVHGRIEMHLVASRPVDVLIPERGSISFARGDAMRTEISSKYDRASVEAMFGKASMRMTSWLTDERARYALALGVPA